MAAGSIRERNGRFYVRTRVLTVDARTGVARWRQVEKAAGSSRRGAQRMLRALQQEVDDGRFVPSGMSVLELGNKWLLEHVQANLKPGTAASYRGTFYLHVAPALGALRVDDCGAQAIRSLLATKRAEGLSEAGVAKVRRLLHALFGFAHDAGLMSVNPVDGAFIRGKPRARRARGTELSPVQIKRLLDACSPRWRPFFVVALDTGLRRGELIGLRWGDVDLLGRILHVRRSVGSYDRLGNPPLERDRPPAAPTRHPPPAAATRHPPLAAATRANGARRIGRAGQIAGVMRSEPATGLSTKTEAGRRLVPILDSAQAALEELYVAAADTRETAPVFATVERRTGPDGIVRPAGRPLSTRMVSLVFRRYAERAGLPRSIRLHDLRHTAITNAIGQGEDVMLIAAFAGHRKTSTTLDLYGHLMPERVRQAARRMNSISAETLP
jgi:integrase